jgi:UDP-glucose 4-epimerase
LLEHNRQVVMMDCAPSTNSLPGAEYLVVDMRNYNKVINALHGCDALIHLAAHSTPNHPDAVLYNDNTTISYNALSVAAKLGIRRVCLASSVNAIGGEYSRAPRYDYFPIDEQHPTYAEHPYSLSKWVLEQQADGICTPLPDNESRESAIPLARRTPRKCHAGGGSAAALGLYLAPRGRPCLFVGAHG